MSASRTLSPSDLTLSDLQPGQSARVALIRGEGPEDGVALRLRELGFVPGEPVRLMALGPVGAEPLLVQIGYTRFALRRKEARRVLIEAVPVS